MFLKWRLLRNATALNGSVQILKTTLKLKHLTALKSILNESCTTKHSKGDIKKSVNENIAMQVFK